MNELSKEEQLKNHINLLRDALARVITHREGSPEYGDPKSVLKMTSDQSVIVIKIKLLSALKSACIDGVLSKKHIDHMIGHLQSDLLREESEELDENILYEWKYKSNTENDYWELSAYLLSESQAEEHFREQMQVEIFEKTGREFRG